MKKILLSLLIGSVLLSGNEICTKPKWDTKFYGDVDIIKYEMKYTDYIHCKDRNKQDELIKVLKELKGK